MDVLKRVSIRRELNDEGTHGYIDDPTALKTLSHYDSIGNQTKIFNSLGSMREKVYDGKGCVSLEMGPGNSQTTHPLYNKRQAVKYEYYASVQLKKKSEGTVTFGSQVITVSRSAEFFYDSVTDRLVRRQFRDGSKDLYTYLEDGRMKRVERWAVPPGGGSAVRIHWREFSYDARTGQTANVSSPEGTISYGYHLDGTLASIKTSGGYEATYTYDVRGNISTVSGKSVGGTVSYSYNTITGRKTQVARPNGVATAYAYDTRGFLQSITDANGSTPVLTQSYTRDKRGQVLTLSETHQGEAATVWTYGYDNLKRLSTAVATGQNPASYSYTYDKGGNRLTKNSSGVLTRYGYNSLDQIVWEHTAGEGQKSYEFDIYGNLTVEKLAGVTKRTYTWDGVNRMKKAVLSENGKTYEFLYDADGARVKREVSNGSSQVVKTNYLSDYVNPSGYTQALQETDEAGEGRAYIWSGEGLLAQSGISTSGESSGGGGPPPANAQFAHTDHLGTVKALTGTAGVTVAGSAFRYSPFGEKLAGTNATTSYRFTGQYAEDELGLQYHRARWLSPAKAGWLSQDPVYDFPANFGNGYGYAGQNPVVNADTVGLTTMGEISIAGSFSNAIATITTPAFNTGVSLALKVAAQVSINAILTNVIMIAKLGLSAMAILLLMTSSAISSTLSGEEKEVVEQMKEISQQIANRVKTQARTCVEFVDRVFEKIKRKINIGIIYYSGDGKIVGGHIFGTVGIYSNEVISDNGFHCGISFTVKSTGKMLVMDNNTLIPVSREAWESIYEIAPRVSPSLYKPIGKAAKENIGTIGFFGSPGDMHAAGH